MKNKEILRAAAELCQKPDVAALFDGRAPENAEAARADAEFFRTALLLAAWEIADRRAAPERTEAVQSDGFVPYAALSEIPLRVMKISGKEPAAGALAPDGFYAPVGAVTVTYAYRVKNADDEAECALAPGIPPQAAVYYVAAEVYAKEGLLDRSDALAARFERLLSACKTEKSRGSLPVGRWLP